MMRSATVVLFLTAMAVAGASPQPAFAEPETWEPFEAEFGDKGAVVAECRGASVSMTVTIEAVEGPVRGEFFDAFGVSRRNWELTPGFQRKSWVNLVATHFKVYTTAPGETGRVTGRYGCES